MPNSFLPPLPRLIDYTQRPRNARRQPGVQIPYEGSLAPQAGTGGDMSGVVTADMLAPRATGGMMREMPTQTAAPKPFQQQQPWFQNPWTQPFKEDAPYWMRGMKGAG